MRSYNIIALIALFCALPATTLAQDAPPDQEPEPPTIGVSYWKCDWQNMSELAQNTDSLITPIYQELVDEGQILNWGMLTHQWGDSWNVVFYTTAPDTPSFLAANEEAIQRIEERHPDLTDITEYCSEHKDNIYTLQTSTEAPGGPEIGSQ